MQRENHEDAARKRLSKAEEGGLWRNVLASTWAWDFRSRKDDARVWCLRLPVCGLIKATLPGLFPACCLSVCLHSQLGGGQVLRHENMLEEEKDGQSLRLVELERFASCTGCGCVPPDGGRQGGMEMRCWDVMVLSPALCGLGSALYLHKIPLEHGAGLSSPRGGLPQRLSPTRALLGLCLCA